MKRKTQALRITNFERSITTLLTEVNYLKRRDSETEPLQFIQALEVTSVRILLMLDNYEDILKEVKNDIRGLKVDKKDIEQQVTINNNFTDKIMSTMNLLKDINYLFKNYTKVRIKPIMKLPK